jgi:hypothetical protein
MGIGNCLEKILRTSSGFWKKITAGEIIFGNFSDCG